MSTPNPDIVARFRGVENSAPADENQKAEVKGIREAALALALEIDGATLNPRYAATALTHLETATMFAVKGVFQ